MKEQIQNFIAEGQIEDALDLLVKHLGNDGILLQGRYNSAKKQHNMGVMDYGEWSRALAQISAAALDLAGKIKPANTGATGNAPAIQPVVNSTGNAFKTFISYNHKDQSTAFKVRDYLQDKGVDVILDQDDMAAGRSIMEFIQESIKKADAVLSIVSSNSLQSGWVGQESVASLYAVWLADKKFIPVALDGVAFDSKFQIEALTNLKKKIESIDEDIKTIRELGSDARDLEEDRRRITDLKNDFSKILQRLKSVLMLDISGDNFDKNMPKVLNALS